MDDIIRFQKSALHAASRLFKNGATDGASIVTLYQAAGEFPPPHIYADQEALFELDAAEAIRLVQRMGNTNPSLPN